MLPPVWCTTYIRLLDQCYTRSEKSIASPTTIRRHIHHMDHPLDLRCHPLHNVCSPFEVEVDRRGRGQDGGRSHGLDGESGRGTPVPTLPTLIPLHTYPSPSIPPHTYTSPSIPPHTYTSLPYMVSLEPASIAVDITFSSHPLSSPTVPPIDDTILDLISELGPLPAR